MSVNSQTTRIAPVFRTKVSDFSHQKIIGVIGLLAIIVLGAFLRFYDLGAYSIGNTYYAATVKSMLTSWHNFFYVSFEPGGSVTVDKPPLGFWIQAISAYFLGVNGFALALPQALAGTLSIPVLYHLIRKYFGIEAGLTAAFVLALMPVTIATERNNTIDGLLVLVLLLAAWTFLKATETGKTRHLLIGAILIGLGFNIKMLQAYMVLPAFFAVYFFCARASWWKRITQLGVATIVMLVVSFAWVVAVDLTPADQRPYIGSSTNNTVLELVVGHNGLNRLGVLGGGRGGDGGPRSRADGPRAGQPPTDGPTNRPPAGNASSDQNIAPRGNLANQPPPPPRRGGPGGGGRSGETGSAGMLRLFEEPLVTEASWLLPLVLLGLPIVLVTIGWSRPLTEKHNSVFLWAGWLLPSLAYFSFNTGLFHRYYLIMLGPPLAALVGISLWSIAKHWKQNHTLTWLGAAFITGVTIIFQIYTFRNYPDYVGWVIAISSVSWLVGVGILALNKLLPARRVGLALVLLAMLVAPFVWSLLTTLNTNPNVALPTAGIEASDQARSTFMTPNQTTLTPNGQVILDYLLTHTDPDEYLLATLNASGAAPYILETGRKVLTLGGFRGSDDVVGVDDLIEMIDNGELRYILGVPRQKQEIAQWMGNNCSVIDLQTSEVSGPGDRQNEEVLYDCGN